MGLRIGATLTHKRRIAFVRIRRRGWYRNELFGCRFHVLGCKWYRCSVAMPWSKSSCRIRSSVLSVGKIVRSAIDLADTRCFVGTIAPRTSCRGRRLCCGVVQWLRGSLSLMRRFFLVKP